MPASKPLPEPTPETAPFWEGAKRHELRMQYCRDCRRYYFFPRPLCRHCLSANTEWRTLSGRGKLHTYVINHRAAPGFEADAPYVIAIVEVEEGPRMMTNIVGLADPAPAMLAIDAPVEVVWDDVSDAVTLPKFRLAAGASS